MKTLIKTLFGERGELYTVADGRRVLLARCCPKIEIYQHSQRVNSIGVHGCNVKSRHVGVVICAEREMTRETSLDFLERVSRFEFLGDFQREDGIFERIRFDNIVPDELNLDDDWTFEVVGQMELVKRLMTF